MTFHFLSGCTESNPGQPACLIALSVDSNGTLRLWCHQNLQTVGTCAAVSDDGGGGGGGGPHHAKVSPQSVHPSSSLLFLTTAWQFAPVCQQPCAIKPMLSAVLSAGHRQWGSANSAAAETRCPAGGVGGGVAGAPACRTQEAGPHRVPVSGPWLASAGVNASRHSSQ